MNELPESVNVGWLLLMLAMPFITGFHVAMGAPWMLTAVLVEVVCIGLLAFFVASDGEDDLPAGTQEDSIQLQEKEPDILKS